MEFKTIFEDPKQRRDWDLAQKLKTVLESGEVEIPPEINDMANLMQRITHCIEKEQPLLTRDVSGRLMALSFWEFPDGQFHPRRVPLADLKRRNSGN